MKFLKRLNSNPRLLKILPKAGCLWCTEGLPPEPPTEICQACHADFKQLLCSVKWNKTFRLARLSTNPMCQDCGKVAADTIDHVLPWKRRPDLFWDDTNTRCLCRTCHNVKTNSHDGGGYRPQKKSR